MFNMKYTLTYANSNDVGITCDSLEELSLYLERDVKSVYGSVWRLVRKGTKTLRVYDYDGTRYDLSISDELREQLLHRMGNSKNNTYRDIVLTNSENRKWSFGSVYYLSGFLNRPYDKVCKSLLNITKGITHTISDKNGNEYNITFVRKGWNDNANNNK